MKEKAKQIIVWVLLGLVALACAGCHTLSGVGQDLIDTTNRYTER